MKEKQHWNWLIATYLFLGGLGGGIAIISAAADLFWGEGEVVALGSLLAGVILALGSGLLCFDLGRPLQFWRVFSRQKTVMTAGAWMLAVLIITSLWYFSFWVDVMPWRELTGLRQTLAVINLLLGVGVCIYTGILLGSMKARPFWNSPALPVLFLISGVSTGIAGQSLTAGGWPYSGVMETATLHDLFRTIDLGLISLEMVIVFVYVIMMRTSAGEEAGIIAGDWLRGNKGWAFWGGLIGLGLILPGALYLWACGDAALILESAGVLFGGLVLRMLMVYSGRRKPLPDEEN